MLTLHASEILWSCRPNGKVARTTVCKPQMPSAPEGFIAPKEKGAHLL